MAPAHARWSGRGLCRSVWGVVQKLSVNRLCLTRTSPPRAGATSSSLHWPGRRINDLEFCGEIKTSGTEVLLSCEVADAVDVFTSDRHLVFRPCYVPRAISCPGFLHGQTCRKLHDIFGFSPWFPVSKIRVRARLLDHQLCRSCSNTIFYFVGFCADVSLPQTLQSRSGNRSEAPCSGPGTLVSGTRS